MIATKFFLKVLLMRLLGLLQIECSFFIYSLYVIHQIYMFNFFTLLTKVKIEKKLNQVGTCETSFNIDGLRIDSFDSISRVSG